MGMYTTLVDAAELALRLIDPSWVIFDCRFDLTDPGSGRRDFAQAHIPGAQYVHLDEDLSGTIVPGVTGRHPLPAESEFISKLRSWGVSTDSQVVVYDQGHGGIAARLWWMLQCLGHRYTAVLDGGWQAWLDDDRPVTSAITPRYQGDFVSRDSPFSKANAHMVEDTTRTLIDARAAKRYAGEEEPIDPVAGHIPGARNRPFLDNLGPDGRWKDRDQLRREWAETHGVPSATEVIVYCGSGVTACHDILSLAHAGLGHAVLYPGSWSDWITDEGRGVSRSSA